MLWLCFSKYIRKRKKIGSYLTDYQPLETTRTPYAYRMRRGLLFFFFRTFANVFGDDRALVRRVRGQRVCKGGGGYYSRKPMATARP